MGDASPGNCVPSNDGSHCTKHEVPCENGCGNYHLRSQDICKACQEKILADERRDRIKTPETIKEAEENAEDAF